MFHMFRIGSEKAQVGWVIVFSIFVLVVNNFSYGNPSSKNFFHYHNMLTNIPLLVRSWMGRGQDFLVAIFKNERLFKMLGSTPNRTENRSVSACLKGGFAKHANLLKNYWRLSFLNPVSNCVISMGNGCLAFSRTVFRSLCSRKPHPAYKTSLIWFLGDYSPVLKSIIFLPRRITLYIAERSDGLFCYESCNFGLTFGASFHGLKYSYFKIRDWNHFSLQSLDGKRA